MSATPVSAQTGPAARPGWTRQFVGRAGDADDYSLTRTSTSVSASGVATILYCDGPNANSGFDLVWARGPRSDGSFHRESIDPGDQLITGNASLAVGARGRSYVSYVSGVFGDQGVLRFAERTKSGWTTETVDPQTSTIDASIALDGGGHPLIAYIKTDGQVRLARHTASGWTTSPVAQEEQGPVAIALAVDAAGRPDIAYITWDGSAYVARLASFDGTHWQIETVGHVGSQSLEFGLNLALTRSGRPLLVFPVLDPVQGLDFAHRTASGWRLQRIARGDIRYQSAALDPMGHLHVTYYGANQGALRHAERVDGQWTITTIADSKSDFVRIGRQSSIAIDATGKAHVAYYVGRITTGTSVHYAVSTSAP